MTRRTANKGKNVPNIIQYCTILQISNRVVQGRGKGQDYTVLEALGLDLLSPPPSPNTHTVFSQLNAPGVYLKLGMVDSAFLCMNKLIWACHVLRKGYYSFFLAAVYLALKS